MKPQPTLNCIGRIWKRSIKDSPCHPELAAPLVADEKEAYKGGCSQSISGSSRRQKYSAICTQKTNVGLKAQPTLIPVSSCQQSIVMQCLRPHSPRKLAFTLAEFFLPYYNSPRKVAFTLAEVLITLGIIGIVSAMTIPTLLARHNEKVWLTQFKKVYSTLYQAYYRAYPEYGTANEWGLDGSKESLKKVYDILAKYLNVGIEYGFKRPNDVVYKDLTNVPVSGSDFFSANLYNFSLSDGTLIGLTYDSEIPGILLVVDLNGSKGPNQLGKDLFYFSLISKKKTPFVSGYPKWWTAWPKACNLTGSHDWINGGSCANWVIVNGNMDYLHRTISVEEWMNVVKMLLISRGNDEVN